MALVAVGVVASSAAIAAGRAVSGRVQSSTGHALKGAEVRFLELTPAGHVLLARAETDRSGFFRVKRLGAGPYRVTAHKHGYRAYRGVVQEAGPEPLELVLSREGDPPPARPEDPGWALRLPRRGVLHEREAAPAEEVAEGAAGAERPLRLGVAHTVSGLARRDAVQVDAGAFVVRASYGAEALSGRSVLWDAGWRKRLNPRNRLDVRLDYRDRRNPGFDRRDIGASGRWERDWSDALSVHAAVDVRGEVERERFALVPRIGGRLRVVGIELDGAVSFHAGDGSLEEPPGRIGYRASLRIPVAEGWEVSGGSTYEPVAWDSERYLPAGVDGRPLWISDGGARRLDNRVSIHENRGSARTRFEVAGGRAAGRLHSLLDAAAGASDVRYRNASLGLALPELGTDVAVEYQSVVSTGGADGLDDAERLRAVELRVSQEMPTISLPGAWHLLLAVRVDSAARPESYETALAEPNRRVGAGVSVWF